MYSIKQLAKLTRKSYRDQEGVFLAEGKKIIEEAVKARAEIIQLLVTNQFQRQNADYLRHLDRRVPVVEISEANLARLSGTKTPPGILAVIKKPEITFEQLLTHHRVAVFDTIKDPGNLGTMLRTADWFGITAIIVTHSGVNPYNDKVLRSTMGSQFHQQVYVSYSLTEDLRKLKAKNFSLIVSTLHPQATSQTHTKSDKWALVMGNESTGVSQAVEQLADRFFTIPGRGQAESLNVAVSFGIMLNALVN